MPGLVSPGSLDSTQPVSSAADDLLRLLGVPSAVHEHTDTRPHGLELADIVREHGHRFQSLTTEQRRALKDIASCRTALLGGHVLRCNRCSHFEISYDSCSNRNCPKCGGLSELRWIERRKADLLPVEYFHVVFTTPDSLRSLFLANQRIAYGLLFSAVSETLLEVARNPERLGARIGFLAVLHTWTQTLLYHPHIHCIVAGGGLSEDAKSWIPCKKGYLLPVQVLSPVFRGKLLSKMEVALANGELRAPASDNPTQALKKAASKGWVVYSKPSFAGPDHVIAYLAHYTRRIAISNHRLVSHQDGNVTFRYTDRANGNKKRLMTLPAEEFLRRFLLHVLPSGFMRVRYYGYLANAHRTRLLELIRQILGLVVLLLTPQPQETWQELILRLTGNDVTRCKQCGLGQMEDLAVLPPSPKWSTPGRATSP